MFNERLREARKKAGLTQKFVASQLNMTEAGYCGYETGKRVPNAIQIARIAKIIGVTGDYLLETEPLYAECAVPLLGRIACGEPILAEQNVEEYISLPSGVKADYALTCRGESMTGAGIQDGDVVFIRANTDVQNGQIAAVRNGDEATLKRLRRTEHGVILLPENPDYDPIIYTEGSDADVEILGLAVAYLHKLV